jgi:hypothetical protein
LLATTLLPSAFQACDNKANAPQTSGSDFISHIQQGTWRYSNHNFTSSNGNVTARKDASTIHGKFRKGIEDSKQKFQPEFNPSLAPWNGLNEDWEIFESPGNKMHLKDDSGSGGGTDFLTFEKN